MVPVASVLSSSEHAAIAPLLPTGPWPSPKQLAPYLRQLILNPCAGHPPQERTIHTASFLETLREFAALDGAFVISHTGVVEAAGAYLDAPTKRGTLRRGFGARTFSTTPQARIRGGEVDHPSRGIHGTDLASY